MAKLNGIVRAYKRYATLVCIIDAEIVRAKNASNLDRYVEFGLVDTGDKVAEAKAKINLALTELRDLTEHLGVLDVAASFELAFRNKITNLIGEARKAIEQQHKRSKKTTSSPEIVKNIDDMQGLAAIKAVLSGGLSIEVKDKMDRIKTSRNEFSHGIDIKSPTAIKAKDAMDCLLDVYESF